MNILIIDDEFTALKKTEIMLSSFGTCKTAMNGKKAQALFTDAVNNKNPFSLITIDINLPDLSGIELLKFFCNEERNSDIVSVKFMITAHSSKDNVVEAIKLCDAFFVKPVKKEIFHAKLNEIFSVR